MLPLLGIVHIVALCAMTAYGVRATRLPATTALVAVAVIVWSNLVVSGHLLSLFAKLDVVWLYLAVSLCLGLLTASYLRRSAPRADPGPESDWPPLPYERYLIWFLLLTGAAFAGLTLLIAATHIASNPDTIVYRFPRVFWYLGKGSLEHFSAGTDPRILFYPLNGVLLYWPLAIYQFQPVWFNAPTVVAWGLVAATTYALGREFGARRVWALASAWLIALTPNVLAQAVSTNDEILAASALSAGLLFLFRWSRRGAPFDFLLGAAGVCLSVGTKLHAYFYWPYLVVLAVVLMLNWRAVLTALAPLLSWRGAAAILASIVLAVMMVASFILFNLRAAGQVTQFDFARQVLNTPLDLMVSLQTIAVYAAQITLTPLADMTLVKGMGSYRIPIYTAFNEVFAPYFKWVDNGPAFMSVGYRFTGVASSQAALFNEHTLMLGLNWLAGLVALIWLVAHRKGPAPRWALWTALSFFAWFLGWAGSTKYIEGIGVYIAYAAIVAAPATVFAFAAIGSPVLSGLRWLALAIVAVVQLLTAYNVVFSNTSRSVTGVTAALARKLPIPISIGFTIEDQAKAELARAEAGITHHTINWGQPNWAFMAYNPAVPNFLQPNSKPFPGSDATDPKVRSLAMSRGLFMPDAGDRTLHVYPIRKFPAYGNIPLRITGKSSPGLTWIGNLLFALGPEWVFAAGNGVETRHPGRDNYIVFSFNEVSNFGHDAKPIIQVAPHLYGLGARDELEFRYVVTIGGVAIDRTDWSFSPMATLRTDGLTATNGTLRIEVRNKARDSAIDAVDVALRSVTPPELPQ
jgi:hypothetical protein